MDEERKQFLLDRINACPYNVHTGIYARSVEEGHSVVVADLKPESMNIWNVPHGGLLFALADVAAGLSAQSVAGGRIVTVNGNINFLDTSLHAKQLRAEGRVIRSGRTTVFTNVLITDDTGLKIAAGQFVMHRIGE